MKIIPSIASASQLDLKCQLDRIRDVPYIHIDVEDGNFLPNITFGMKTVKEMAAYSKAELDVHLLTTNPIKYIPVSYTHLDVYKRQGRGRCCIYGQSPSQ